MKKTPTFFIFNHILTKVKPRLNNKFWSLVNKAISLDCQNITIHQYMKIIFMGTPEFAVPSLDILVKNDYEVVAVITATDKWGGRGNKTLLQSAVKKYAVSHNIPVLQPKNLKNKQFLEELRAYEADLQIVVAFRMLPVAVWDMPRIGTFNLHGSLLPKYRGAAPIHWAVIKGEKETGVTTFFLKHEIDTGNILLSEKTPIGEHETTGDVHDRLMQIGAEVVLKTVKAVESGDYTPQLQDESLVSHAPKLHDHTCEIDFDEPTEKVYNFIRGLSPYPVAWTTLDGKKLKIYQCRPEYKGHEIEPGELVHDKKILKIATRDGFIHLHELQLSGRKRMKVSDFLNGYKF